MTSHVEVCEVRLLICCLQAVIVHAVMHRSLLCQHLRLAAQRIYKRFEQAFIVFCIEGTQGIDGAVQTWVYGTGRVTSALENAGMH